MKTYIALLRGINVGGKKKVLMAELRDLLTELGLKNVRTYIQSGNIIFNAEDQATFKLEDKISKGMQLHFGFDVPVLVKTHQELQQIFNACPFSEEKKQKSYFSLLYNNPDETLMEDISKIDYQNEVVAITQNCVYLYSAVGYGKTKFNNNFFERKLKVMATARNYKTMLKLLELASEYN